MSKLWNVGKPLPPVTGEPPVLSGPDWVQANPERISAHLERALARPTGGWYVIDASANIADKPRKYVIDSRDLVVWRSGDGIMAAPNECPHMGAALCEGFVQDGQIVCPWHGLALGSEPFGAWQPNPVHDDGILCWVQLDTGEEPTPVPIIAERPTEFFDGVMRMEAGCEPEDVIANRLDPWHGVHFHPYAFGRLALIAMDDDSVTVRVAFRMFGPVVMEVDARFHSPEPRTIVMTIVEGSFKGSVVETHATPTSPGRSAIIEASLFTSDAKRFKYALRGRNFARSHIIKRAETLWVDDGAYAERRYEIRTSNGANRRQAADGP